MKISVLIPVGGLTMTDPHRRGSLEWLLARYDRLLPPDSELCLGQSASEPFNRSEARNDAFADSSGDMLIVADADTIFHWPQIAKAITMINETGAPWVIPYDVERYYNLSEECSQFVLSTSPHSEIPEPPDPAMWEFKVTSWAGLLVLPRSAWEKVGGYDERFTLWGYEDNAFRFALDHLVGAHRRVTGPLGYCMHLWHPAAETERFGNEAIEAQRALCRRYECGELPKTNKETA